MPAKGSPKTGHRIGCGIGMDSMGYFGIPRYRTGKKDENDIDIDFYRLK
jgi:hypothetical protein